MLKYFKKICSVVLVAVLIVTVTVPSGVVAASKPGRPSFKVVKRAKKSVTLKINKTKNATGYQIFIANSKHGKYKQTAATRIRTVKISKLKKDKSYYIKIRAFKTVGYHITYGKFSKIIKVDKYGKKPKPETSKPGAEETPVPEITETPVPGITDEPVPGEPEADITQAPIYTTSTPVPDVTPYP